MPRPSIIRAMAARQRLAAGFLQQRHSNVIGLHCSAAAAVHSCCVPPRLSCLSVSRPRRGFANRAETLEEMAKRLSDEADEQFRASGRESSVRTRRPQRPAPPPPQPDPAAPAADREAAGAAEAAAASASAQQQPEQPAAKADDSSAASTESPSSSASSSPSSSSSSSSLLSSLSREWENLQQYVKKFQRPVSAFTRVRRDVKEVLQHPTILPKKKEAATADEAAAASDAADSGSSSDVPDPTAPPPPSALVLVDADTVWDKRMERMRRSFASSAPFLRFRKASRQLIAASNPLLRPLVDTLDDMRLTWETSQHPALFKVRDVADRVVGETEMGFAIGEIIKVDPAFDLLSFTAEMEEYMIPVVITAYLRGSPSDARLLSQCSEGFAASLFRTSLQARLAAGEEWDHRILDISHVELQKAVMLKDLPVLQLVFMIQQVNCVRKVRGAKQKQPAPAPAAAAAAAAGAAAEGAEAAVKEQRYDSEGREIVLGSESDITSMYYHWVLRRDFENPDFDWKIMEMSSQKVLSIV